MHCNPLRTNYNDCALYLFIIINITLYCYRGNGSFKNFARMTSADFENLINIVGHKIKKQDTNFRNAIPVKERLAITLRFLASGDSFHSLMYLFRVSKQSISSIIPEVCEALISGLHTYVKVYKLNTSRINIYLNIYSI